MLDLRPLLLTSLCVVSCATPPGEPLVRRGDEISVCGQLFHIGTPVVLWNDPGGFDAYSAKYRYSGPPPGDEEQPDKQRYGTRDTTAEIANRVSQRGWELEDLQSVVRQFVVHYDVCGTSKQCFKVLEARGLSVHFMLDIDGTIYQTLDLKERAWHASQANSASVGIEVAQIGAYEQPTAVALRSWYREDEQGPYVRLPEHIDQTAIRTPDFVARPARSQMFDGVIHGKKYYQYDFTEEQYAALTRLTAALHRVLPRIALDAPRDDEGAVLRRALTDDELKSFEGVIGHWHVTTRKTDPGPAFDWERVLQGARELVD